MLTLTLGDIPKRLQAIPDPPKVLHVLGRPLDDYEKSPRVAIVGSRRVSAYGRHVTSMLAERLARDGVVIVSGLALGVDSIAHDAALRAGGLTVAVLPGGIGRIYPRSHEALARAIVVRNGSLISEKPGIGSPMAHDFLIRNRLVAGFSDAVLITEAAARSGSLNTARHALEQGKTVFAVPGNITSDTSAGTNNLLKAGAVPVSDVEDIYAAMGWDMTKEKAEVFGANNAEQRIIDTIRSGVSSSEELLLTTGLSQKAFTESMTMLEISGTIRPLGNNCWAIG